MWNDVECVKRHFINPILYLFSLEDMEQGNLNIINTIPYSDLEQLPKWELEKCIANKDALEYGHALESLIGVKPQ